MFFHQSDAVYHHLFVDSFKHVVDGECSGGYRSERFHLDTCFPDGANGGSNGNANGSSGEAEEEPESCGCNEAKSGWEGLLGSALACVGLRRKRRFFR